MSVDLDRITRAIIDANEHCNRGDYQESYAISRKLLDELPAAGSPPLGQWRAEVLDLVGRCALHIGRPGEAIAVTGEAVAAIRDLDDDQLSPLVEAYIENLLVAHACAEPAEAADLPGTHRSIRARLVAANSLTDRHRLRESIDVLNEVLVWLTTRHETDDARLLYLPVALGLLGFNSFHSGNLEQARSATERAMFLCQQTGDRSGVAIYQQNLLRVAGDAGFARHRG